jgi:hypothetical protein
MWSPPSRSVFGSQIRLFLVSLAMYLLYEWRGWIRNRIYWDIK